MARLAFLIGDMGGGGAERVTVSVVNGATRRGHQVDLLLMSATGPNLELVDPAVCVIDLGARRIRNVVRPLVRYLRRERPAALQVSMWPMTIVAILASRLSRTGVKVVTTEHTMLTWHHGRSRLEAAVLRPSLGLFYPLAHRRTTVSHGSSDELARLSRTAVETIQNPIPAVGPGPDAGNAWPAGARRLLSVGALKREKNQLLMVEALALLPASLNAALVILGEGPMRAELEARIAALGLGEQVLLPGYVVDPAPFYRAADLFVLASDYEGFGNVLVEAMSAGLAVISTDCPVGPAEILEGGEFGALTPCGDAAALAVAVREALARPADPARQKQRAAQFAEDVAVERYLAMMLG